MKSAMQKATLLKCRLWCMLACMLTLNMFCGCQLAPKEKSFKWPWAKDESKPLPDRILPVWTDSVLHQPNKAGVRGFGGRIYFYAKDDTDPIEVDGSLAIYVFDADEIDVAAQKPLRKYVFTAEQFVTHMSKSSIGPSYSIWLPWGEIGGPPRRLSLIARFEGKDGGTTISDPTIKLLPGVPVKKQDESEATPPSNTPFRLSGHQKKFSARPNKDKDQLTESEDEATQDAEKDDSASDVKTIELPPSFQRHLRSDGFEANKPVESKPIERSSSKSSNSLPNQTSNPTSSDGELKSGNLAASVDAAQVASPVTTQVYDYRTRKNDASAFKSAKNDIRQGRWIESIKRD